MKVNTLVRMPPNHVCEKKCDFLMSNISLIPSNLFLDGLGIGLGKEGEQSTGEIVGVAVWVPQLVGYGIQEQVATWAMSKS